jgi:DNA-directed RNA polymerase subunit RPC12/RpoP
MRFREPVPGDACCDQGVGMMIRCGICGREFASEAELQGHRHDQENDATPDALTCPACGDRFEREEDLVAHQAKDHVGVEAPDEERAVP